MGKFDGKVVIITGGGKGIGFGISNAFAKEGANLVLTGRTMKTLEEAKAALEQKYGIQVLPVIADGGNQEAVRNVVTKAAETFGRIDVVVNNAQVSKSGLPLEEHTKEDFDVAINSGLYATFYYMVEALPHIKKTKGCYINFASGAGFSGKIGQSSYAAAKEGIRGLSRVAANEWGKYGVNVNIVAPLATTPGLQAWEKEYPELYKSTIRDIPMQHFGDPETEIGPVCVFLASPEAKYITGQTIQVDGGVNLRP